MSWGEKRDEANLKFGLPQFPLPAILALACSQIHSSVSLSPVSGYGYLY
jgi:hypothetical protein